MKGSRFGEGAPKPYPAKSQANAESASGCSFCWFVLTIYPSLTGMTESDGETFREHLIKSHALKRDIMP